MCAALGSSPRRLLALVVVVVVVLAVITGCAQPGSALPDQRQVAAFKSGEFDRAYTALFGSSTDNGYLVRDHDEKATVYQHAEFLGKKADKEIDIFRVGSPPALLARARSGIPGDQIDTYHPGGSDRDFLLLGARYSSLAPTRWVVKPTDFPRIGFTVCLLPGVMTICAMKTAMDVTRQNSKDGVVKDAVIHRDGSVELLTGVTLRALVDAHVLPFPDELRQQVTGAMLATLVPTRINLGPDGSLTKIEMNASVPGGRTPLNIQVGYLVTGKAVPSDFPPAPSGFDVTVLPDAAAVHDFNQRLIAIP